jgi:hypothetical protein
MMNSGSLAYDVALVRLLSDGSRDAAGFGVDGYVRTDAGHYDEAFAVKVAGGSLYVAGHSGGQALAARYSLSNGALVPALRRRRDRGQLRVRDDEPRLRGRVPDLLSKRFADAQAGDRRNVFVMIRARTTTSASSSGSSRWARRTTELGSTEPV